MTAPHQRAAGAASHGIDLIPGAVALATNASVTSMKSLKVFCFLSSLPSSYQVRPSSPPPDMGDGVDEAPVQQAQA